MYYKIFIFNRKLQDKREYIDSYIAGIRNKKYHCSAEIRELLYYFEGILFAEKKVGMYQQKRAKDILIDRYILSFLSYGPLNGIPVEQIKTLIQSMPWPDVYFYLDILPEKAYTRIEAYREIDMPEIGYRNAQENKNLSKKNFILHQTTVRNNFLNQIECCTSSVTILDGMQSYDKLVNQCLKGILEKNRNLM